MSCSESTRIALQVARARFTAKPLAHARVQSDIEGAMNPFAWRAKSGLLVLSVLAACGSRTGLLSSESAPWPIDAAVSDATVRPRRDAAPDALVDALPPIDARPPQDVNRNDCPDASSTFIYVVTSDRQLLSFYPPTRAFRTVGTLACPDGGSTPFSMAVDRKGVAYVLYNSGEIFRVSTLTGACIATPYRTGQQGFSLFGMGFSSDAAGPVETLFVAGDSRQGGTAGLARIGIPGFGLTAIGGALPSATELTGTGDGRLFGFYNSEVSGGSIIGQIDKASGNLIAEDSLQVSQGTGWAFAFWGGSFYLFTGQDTSSAVTKYDPMLRQESNYGGYSSLIVGAGVSTCAPSE
jgi:hypothetical protein